MGGASGWQKNGFKIQRRWSSLTALIHATNKSFKIQRACHFFGLLGPEHWDGHASYIIPSEIPPSVEETHNTQVINRIMRAHAECHADFNWVKWWRITRRAVGCHLGFCLFTHDAWIHYHTTHSCNFHSFLSSSFPPIREQKEMLFFFHFSADTLAFHFHLLIKSKRSPGLWLLI